MLEKFTSKFQQSTSKNSAGFTSKSTTCQHTFMLWFSHIKLKHCPISMEIKCENHFLLFIIVIISPPPGWGDSFFKSIYTSVHHESCVYDWAKTTTVFHWINALGAEAAKRTLNLVWFQWKSLCEPMNILTLSAENLIEIGCIWGVSQIWPGKVKTFWAPLFKQAHLFSKIQ